MVYFSEIIHLFLLMILRILCLHSPQASQGYWVLMQEWLETSGLDMQLDAQNKIQGAGNAPRHTLRMRNYSEKGAVTGYSPEGVVSDRPFLPEMVQGF